VLKDELAAAGVSPSELEALRAPAGLDLGAITPRKLHSIVAEMVEMRRRGQRRPDDQKEEGRT
jgi:xanthine dehydrogenase accessory factor